MTTGWIVCMSLWLFFMLLWGYFGVVKREWLKAAFFAAMALLCALFSLVFVAVELVGVLE